MSTTSITHRPASFVAAASAVLGLAAGGVALSISQQSDNDPSAPAQNSQPTQVQPNTHHHPTTSGGRVMPGL